MKKGQLQAGELVMIVMIVMVLLIVGLVLYASFKGRSYEEKREEIASLDAVDVAQEAASMQEIACGHLAEPGGCIDLHRIQAMSDLTGNAEPDSDVHNYYRSKFGAATIIVEKVYPEPVETWLLYNFTRQSLGDIPLNMPVNIYDPVEKESYLGIIKVVMHS